MQEIKLKVKTILTVRLPDDKKVDIDKIVETLDCIFSLDGEIVESEIFDTEILKKQYKIEKL